MSARRCIRCTEGIPHEIKHGTWSGYTYHACRCAECRAIKAASDARYRAVNRDSIRDRKSNYYESHRDRVCSRERARRSADPKVIERERKYASARREARRECAREAQRVSKDHAGQRRFWTSSEDQILTNSWDKTAIELAFLLKRSKGSIDNRRRKLTRQEVAA